MCESSEVYSSERVYCTNALIKRIGRSIAISLEDATLPGTIRNKHMTIFYRRNSHFTNSEINLMTIECNNWIIKQYGNNSAPITFTINKLNNNSVLIKGDLYNLCIYLRNKFEFMSNDSQRIPYVKLYKNQKKIKHKNTKKNKSCYICGEIGHYKKHCPKKEYKNETETEKMKEKLFEMMNKITEIKNEKLNEIKLLNEQNNKLEILFNNIQNFDQKTLKNEIKNIGNEFKFKKKQMKQEKKFIKKQNKIEKKERKYKRKERKKLEKVQQKLYKTPKNETEIFNEQKQEIIRNNNSNNAEIEGENMDIITNENDSDYEFTQIFGENIINID